MPQSLAEPAVFMTRARPVRRLVAAIAAIGVVCVGLWWVGAVGPRLSVVLLSVDADTATGHGTLHIELRNNAKLPVEVRGVSVDDRGGGPVRLGPARIDGRPLAAAGARVSGGGAARLEVPYTVDCNRPGEGNDPVLGVRARAPLGATRTRTAGTAALLGARIGGGESIDPGPLLCPGGGRPEPHDGS